MQRMLFMVRRHRQRAKAHLVDAYTTQARGWRCGSWAAVRRRGVPARSDGRTGFVQRPDRLGFVPRYVDHEARRQDIVKATVQVLAQRGMKGLSFRSVAALLGGSTTLVTHFYATQEELLIDVAVRLTNEWEEDIRSLDAESDDPWQRLRRLLIWLVPTSEIGRTTERARVQLLADQLTGAEHRETLERYERKMRQFLREHVREVVPADRTAEIVDLLRAATSGVVLSALEHPDEWPAKRQVDVVDHLIETVASTSAAAY